MDNSKIKHIFNEFIQRFELYLGCVLFLVMMVLLTIQVFSRYLGNAITWTEELSCIMLVWMSYLGFAGAITSRKHLRIDAFINSRSFKVKKILLIISNIINAAFSAALIVPMYHICCYQCSLSDSAYPEGNFLQHSSCQHGSGADSDCAGMHSPGERGRESFGTRQAYI